MLNCWQVRGKGATYTLTYCAKIPPPLIVLFSIPGVSSIYIAIASYRDPELMPTVRNLAAQANDPSKLFFSIVLQCPPEQIGELTQGLEQYRHSLIWLDSRQAWGVGLARHLGQSFLSDQQWILQLDSHHRAVQGWDQILIEMIKQIPSDKAILSAYVLGYEPPDRLMPGIPSRLSARHFESESKLLHLIGTDDLSKYDAPQLGFALSGHFIFAPANFYREVPYDPAIYFTGEEITLAIRAWTRGWNIYYPNRPVIFHYYGRHQERRHWDDHPDWWKRAGVSLERYKQVVGLVPVLDNLGVYGVGNVRSLRDYQKFSGIDFQNFTLSENALRGVPDVH